MKKLLLVVVALFTLTLSGCVVRKNEVVETTPQLDEFGVYIVNAFVNEFTFVEIGEEIGAIVEAYGYSEDYVITIPEAGTYKITIMVDNDLDMYVGDGINEQFPTETVTPTLLGVNPRVYTYEITEPFLFISFESWDEDEDSMFNFVVEVAGGV